MTTDRRYTLDEAKQQLAEQECLRYGHSYNVESVKTPVDAGMPIGVSCSTCHKHWSVGDHR